MRLLDLLRDGQPVVPIGLTNHTPLCFHNMNRIGIMKLYIIITSDTDPDWDGQYVNNTGGLSSDIKEAATFPLWQAEALSYAYNHRSVELEDTAKYMYIDYEGSTPSTLYTTTPSDN